MAGYEFALTSDFNLVEYLERDRERGLGESGYYTTADN
jgi:hypothetical protein